MGFTARAKAPDRSRALGLESDTGNETGLENKGVESEALAAWCTLALILLPPPSRPLTSSPSRSLPPPPPSPVCPTPCVHLCRKPCCSSSTPPSPARQPRPCASAAASPLPHTSHLPHLPHTPHLPAAAALRSSSPQSPLPSSQGEWSIPVCAHRCAGCLLEDMMRTVRNTHRGKPRCRGVCPDKGTVRGVLHPEVCFLLSLLRCPYHWFCPYDQAVPL